MSTISRFSVESSSHSGIPSSLFPAASSLQFPIASSLLRWRIQGPPKERGSLSCRGCSSHLWSDVAFDHWSTQKCNRVLRRAYQMTGRQECLPVVAQPRRDEDRARILVLPHSSALLHWPILPLWGSWILRRVSSSPELGSMLLSTCTDAQESITNPRSSGFVEEGAGITQGFGRRVECILCLLFEFVDLLWQVPYVSAGASLPF